MTEAEAIAALDALPTDDPEEAHAGADSILLKVVSSAISDAYERVIERAGAWWYA